MGSKVGEESYKMRWWRFGVVVEATLGKILIDAGRGICKF